MKHFYYYFDTARIITTSLYEKQAAYCQIIISSQYGESRV